MTLDLTITIGTIIELAVLVATIFAVYTGLKNRLASMETTLAFHAERFAEQGERMERYEAGMIKIVSDVQRLIGRMDIPPFRRDRGGNARS